MAGKESLLHVKRTIFLLQHFPELSQGSGRNMGGLRGKLSKKSISNFSACKPAPFPAALVPMSLLPIPFPGVLGEKPVANECLALRDSL